LLGHVSESQVRLQVASDLAGSKHTGDTRKRGKQACRPIPAQQTTATDAGRPEIVR
jgi:hypothetical protein